VEIRESTKQTAIAAATAAAAADDEKDEREDDAGDAAEEKQDRGEKDQPAPDAASNNKVGEEAEAPGAPPVGTPPPPAPAPIAAHLKPSPRRQGRRSTLTDDQKKASSYGNNSVQSSTMTMLQPFRVGELELYTSSGRRYPDIYCGLKNVIFERYSMFVSLLLRRPMMIR
jgi:hypothetical protein